MKIKFQLCEDTALGIAMNLCSLKSEFPWACCPAPGIPDLSQLGFGSDPGSTTWTLEGSAIFTAVRTWGTVSSARKPLCTATSRIAVAGSIEQYTARTPFVFQRPPYRKAPSPLAQVDAWMPESSRQATSSRPPSAGGSDVTCRRRTRCVPGNLRPVPGPRAS